MKSKRKENRNRGNGHSASSTNADRNTSKGEHLRDRATIKRLKIYSTKPIRDKSGKIIKYDLQSKEVPDARVAPNRRWFGNTRVVSQQALEQFRSEIKTSMKNPYTFLMQQHKIPFGLVNDNEKQARCHLISTESFEETFGAKRRRKRPKLIYSDLNEFSKSVDKLSEEYDEQKDRNIKIEEEMKDERKNDIFDKGTSKRIWGELYKVIDASDVIVQVIDARDPMGTRCKHIEEYLIKEKKHKHLILVLNKCDLIPTWASARWVRLLSSEYPTLAFHASITNPFGKGSLIQLLRQFSKLHNDKKQISVGFIGYPNVGKSSIINTLRAKKVCKVAPIPGETKVWQYITLMRNIFLVDCPGVVYPSGESETDLVLKGVVRIENVPDCLDHIPVVLERVKREYLVNTYNIETWEDHLDFLAQFSKKTGKLLKGGEPDLNTAAKMILNDWQRGKIPYFVCPPFDDADRENDSTHKESSHETITSEKSAPFVEQNFEKIRVLNKFSPEELPTELQDIYQKQYSGAHNEGSFSDKEEDLVPDWDEIIQELQAGEEVTSVIEEENEKIEPQTKTKKKQEFLSQTDQESVRDGSKRLSKKNQIGYATIENESRDSINTGNEHNDKLCGALVKPKRMKTNKRKTGSRFYEEVNVKNRKRKRKRAKHQIMENSEF